MCTLPEAMIYVADYQTQYESVYGVEMWEHDFGGITLEEYVKNIIVSQLASMKAITLLAKDYEVELSLFLIFLSSLRLYNQISSVADGKYLRHFLQLLVRQRRFEGFADLIIKNKKYGAGIGGD